MKIEDFDYELPRDLIAQFPAPKRDEARLMIVRRDTGDIQHSRFVDLMQWLRPGDLLVSNNTGVIPARLRGRKLSGGKVEILLCEVIRADGRPVPLIEDAGAFGQCRWRCLVTARGRMHDGMRVDFGKGYKGVLSRLEDGGWSIRFSGVEDLRELMDEIGEMPLPPYIRRNRHPMDRSRYQTVYARREGSIAAPTAGLHFTEPITERLRDRGIRFASITLQIGVGTFFRVRTPQVEDHRMHAEYVEVGERCCRAWSETRSRGGRVIAVGTTTVRALESAFKRGHVAPFREFTRLFIVPGYRFQAVDGLITNFHLPKSTLLMLVMAFAGKEAIGKAYREAIVQRYRFFSYGDSMLIH